MITKATVFRLLLVAPRLVATLALRAPSPAAAATACSGTFGAVTFNDNLIVSEYAPCILNGTIVRGCVTVNPGAALFANGADIRGSVIAIAPRTVVVDRSAVRGDGS